MPPTMRRMLAEQSLELKLLIQGTNLDETIQWVHSSDLSDPTPFLEAGQVLLTTGTQFPSDARDADYNKYVERLVARGVLGVGFGTEVIRTSTPSELIAACKRSGLVLFEVPYNTPFIAVVRWAAGIIDRESRERDLWSLSAQRAISLAALGPRRLAGVLTVLGQQLSCRVAVFQPDGAFDAVVSPSAFDEQETTALSSEAIRLLRAEKRSAATVTIGETRATFQTLGTRGDLGGVLALVGCDALDRAGQAVLTNAVALAEIAFQEHRQRNENLQPLHGELLALLCSGQADLVRRAFPGLPGPNIRVVMCQQDVGSQWLIEALERRTTTAKSRPFIAPSRADLAVIVDEETLPAVSDFLALHDIPAGISAPATIGSLTFALAQARQALSASLTTDGAPTDYFRVSNSAYVSIASGTEMIDIAAARLSPLIADDRGIALLRDCYIWLVHNCAWETSAKELGVHRHSLKSRVSEVFGELRMSYSSFADRAELWTMIQALDLESISARPTVGRLPD